MTQMKEVEGDNTKLYKNILHYATMHVPQNNDCAVNTFTQINRNNLSGKLDLFCTHCPYLFCN